MSNYLEEIFARLLEHRVDFVVCGGVAAVLHGVERMTMDLDLAVDLSTDNLKKMLAAAAILRLSPRAPVPPEYILDPMNIKFLVTTKNALVFTFADPDNPYRQIDIFLKVPFPFDQLKKTAVSINVGASRVLVADLHSLIRMKEAVQPPREKDLADIRALRQLEKDSHP